MQSLLDEELIERSRAERQPPASDPYLDELFRRHSRRVALWCLRYAGNKEDAADLAQEIMARAFKSLHTFQGNSRFTTWLFTICRNHCLNYVKSRQTRGTEIAEDVLPGLADPAALSALEMVERSSQLALARKWIREQLDDMERMVFTLHYAEEMPLDAITRLLGLTNQSGAKAYIVSARRKLQESLRRWRASHERKTSG
jgi:RNA polymerase sigma-70 factor (ECF subfamily)